MQRCWKQLKGNLLQKTEISVYSVEKSGISMNFSDYSQIRLRAERRFPRSLSGSSVDSVITVNDQPITQGVRLVRLSIIRSAPFCPFPVRRSAFDVCFPLTV